MITKERIREYQRYSRVASKKWADNKITSEELGVYLPELNEILALAIKKGLGVDILIEALEDISLPNHPKHMNSDTEFHNKRASEALKKYREMVDG